MLFLQVFGLVLAFGGLLGMIKSVLVNDPEEFLIFFIPTFVGIVLYVSVQLVIEV